MQIPRWTRKCRTSSRNKRKKLLKSSAKKSSRARMSLPRTSWAGLNRSWLSHTRMEKFNTQSRRFWTLLRQLWLELLVSRSYTKHGRAKVEVKLKISKSLRMALRLTWNKLIGSRKPRKFSVCSWTDLITKTQSLSSTDTKWQLKKRSSLIDLWCKIVSDHSSCQAMSPNLESR